MGHGAFGARRQRNGAPGVEGHQLMRFGPPAACCGQAGQRREPKPAQPHRHPGTTLSYDEKRLISEAIDLIIEKGIDPRTMDSRVRRNRQMARGWVTPAQNVIPRHWAGGTRCW